MRIIEQIPHPHFRMVLYATETHFLLEIEAGPMRQSYRYAKERFPGAGDVKGCITTAWLEDVRQSFNTMFVDWTETLEEKGTQGV